MSLSSSSLSGEIVAVTGGSGFLAQHLIAHLQHSQLRQNTTEVSGIPILEIRIIDRKPFNKFLVQLLQPNDSTIPHFWQLMIKTSSRTDLVVRGAAYLLLVQQCLLSLIMFGTCSTILKS
ncbi:unnamed protein product [Gongylonema pulchrum]|uniref:3Beta_HSD domain-containing protein n=1 Tax=Gongylonema pulchrum TaxID=637853 RepID=A0A183DH60_9BILA|nr:unnamed protein product [Gongylonema pulchrum]